MEKGEAPVLFKDGCLFAVIFNSNSKADKGAWASSRTFEDASMMATAELPMCKGAVVCNGTSGPGRTPCNVLTAGGVAVVLGVEVEEVAAETPRYPCSGGRRSEFHAQAKQGKAGKRRGGGDAQAPGYRPPLEG